MSLGVKLAEAGRVPDFLLRAAIISRHRAVLRREDPGTAEARQEALRRFIASLQNAPVAPAPMDSNLQHYEVPPALFGEMLGPRLKYSACVWPAGELSRTPRAAGAERELGLLAQAEEKTLALTAERAEVDDGMRILELGCGWGSFSLWAAEYYPNSRIWAVSNSRDQGEFIRVRAKQRGLGNIQALTADMNHFEPPAGAGPFDRIVSVEMFEHMRNWPELLLRIAEWLADDGKFFLHIFTHRELAYFFREGNDEWMTRHFFAGGMMPSDSLLLHLQQEMVLEDHWRVSGLHYARTLNSWLAMFDSRRERALSILVDAYGRGRAGVHLHRWRLFLLACAELFAFDSGNQWMVSHYRMAKGEAAMTGKSIAVIGAGISGVVAAHYLARRHRVVLFEAEDRLGGHTNTINIPDRPEFAGDAGKPVDTGFIVFNDRTYPNFIRFLVGLGIQGAATEMSFSFYDEARRFAYAGTSFSSLFARRRNLVSPGFWAFLAGVARFNRRAVRDVAEQDLARCTLAQYLERIKAPQRVRRDYLGPMTQAIWSTPEADAMDYPAAAFLRFFANHGLLEFPSGLVWRYLKGGSSTYLKAFQEQFQGEIRLATPVSAVERHAENGAGVSFPGGAENFDAVVIAAHADQALVMLKDADEHERSALGPWRYSRNRTVLHCDPKHMPPLKRSWACWNVLRLADDGRRRPVRVSYWMNLLQRFQAAQDWLVSLNASRDFAPDSVVYDTVYEHPVYSLDSMTTQKDLPALSGRRNTYFCGAYHGYGFHEDGARSAVDIVRKHFGMDT